MAVSSPQRISIRSQWDGILPTPPSRTSRHRRICGLLHQDLFRRAKNCSVITRPTVRTLLILWEDGRNLCLRLKLFGWSIHWRAPDGSVSAKQGGFPASDYRTIAAGIVPVLARRKDPGSTAVRFPLPSALR